jgi:hypothetical protein
MGQTMKWDEARPPETEQKRRWMTRVGGRTGEKQTRNEESVNSGHGKVNAKICLCHLALCQGEKHRRFGSFGGDYIHYSCCRSETVHHARTLLHLQIYACLCLNATGPRTIVTICIETGWQPKSAPITRGQRTSSRESGSGLQRSVGTAPPPPGSIGRLVATSCSIAVTQG